MQWLSGVLSSSKDGPLSANAASMSGGEVREDGMCSFGFSLLRGKRSGMEDYHHSEFKKDDRTGETVGVFGVFDGHGGPNAADYVRSNLFNNLLQHDKFPEDLAGAIVDSYHSTDEQYMQQDSGAKREDGCTAVTAVIYQRRLYVANVGDSRAVLCRAGQAVAMTVDHKPNDKDERERIETAGGVVVWAGTWRVGGVLAVSRAFGDKPLKKYVISTPSVREEELTPEDEFLILASDGLWDVVTNEEAIGIVRETTDCIKAAKKLSNEAMARGSCDNISCLVIRFKHAVAAG